MGNLIFLNPWYFLLILPLFLMIFILYKSKNNKMEFKFFDDIKFIYGKNSVFYRLFFIILIFLSLFYILILANPNTENATENIQNNGIDIVIVLDLSTSMEANDLKPSRIEAAKNVIDDFLKKVESDRIGLVVFAGKPFASIPLTFDYTFLSEYIETLSTSTINGNLDGTALGDAILLGTNTFDEKSLDREKVMIILTDGDANVGVNPETSLIYLKEKNIKSYTIGIGGTTTANVRVTDNYGFSYIQQIPGINEEILKKIASETGGKYFLASSNQVFEEIFTEISKLEKREIEVEENIIYSSKYYFFYKIILILSLILTILYFKKISY